MKKQSKFAAAAVVLVGVVGYLMVTGMKESMTYFYTPDELASKLVADPSVRETGMRVGGRVVPGSVTYDQTTLHLRFTLSQIDPATNELGAARFPVAYQGPLPDTFEEGRDVVVTGRLSAAGTFEATEVLTKCGSRYEAAEEDFQT